MARVLRFLGTRYGLAAVLLVLVIVVVGVARAVSGPGKVDVVGPPPPLAPSASEALGDDSVATSESPAAPTVIAGGAAPDAVALDFTRAWFRSQGVSSSQWVDGLAPHATPRLIERLRDADPASVPANSIRGPAEVRVRDAHLTEVSIPVVPGMLHLRLIVSNNRWLVDGVDWERP